MDVQNQERRKRLWLVYGRICLTLAILGIITFGLYLLSQKETFTTSASSTSSVSSTSSPLKTDEFLLREKRNYVENKKIKNIEIIERDIVKFDKVKESIDLSYDKIKQNKFRSNYYKSVNNNNSYNKLVKYLVKLLNDKSLFDSINENELNNKKQNNNDDKIMLPISSSIIINLNKIINNNNQQKSTFTLNDKKYIINNKDERIEIEKDADYKKRIISKRSIINSQDDSKNEKYNEHHKINEETIIIPKKETSSDIYLNKTKNDFVDSIEMNNDNDYNGDDPNQQQRKLQHKVRHKKQDILITEGVAHGRYFVPCKSDRYCACNRYGSIDQTCNPYGGACRCRSHIEGKNCDKCVKGYWNLMSGKGCEKCKCDKFGSKSELCNIYTGECNCKEGVTGRKCNQCKDGYYGFSHNGCKKCEVCLSAAQICDPDTGRCICPPRSKGPNCECISNTWGWEHKKGCKSCDCNHDGSIGQCDPTNGQCKCREGFIGHKCNECSYGYYGYPDCRRCNCDVKGSISLTCNDEGQCQCKKSVMGHKCNECQPHMFGLSADNINGCLNCFCFGKTKNCHQSSYTWGQIRMPVARNLSVEYVGMPSYSSRYGFDYVVVIQMQGSKSSREGAEIKTMNGLNLIPNSSGNVSIGTYGPFYDPLYFQLPSQFLKDQINSYGGYLKFSLTSEGCNSKLDDRIIRKHPLIQIHSHEKLILDYSGPETYEWNELPEQVYAIKINELNWRHHQTNRNITRSEMMAALQNIKHIFLRATNSADLTQVVLSNVTLDTGIYISGATNNIAHQIEICNCPEEYNGNSCQDPSSGNYRWKNNTIDNHPVEHLVGFSVPCECNGRSRSCDTETGCCINCRDNTGGLHCEECAEGFFGNPNFGSCQPCPCPETRKNFAKGCYMNGNDVSCLCKPGYTGLRCEKCIDGYFGSPNLSDGKCEECDCNPDGIKSDKCDKTTGQCDCMDGIDGLKCDQCQHPRFMFQDNKCKSCDNCTIILLDQLDDLNSLIEYSINTIGTNITAPYTALEKFTNDVDDLSDLFEDLKDVKDEVSKFDDVSVEKFISKIENSKNKLNKMKNKIEKRKLESSKRLSDAIIMKTDAELMTKDIKDVTSELNDYANHISHVNIGKALQEAEEYLEKIYQMQDKVNGSAHKNFIAFNCSRHSFDEVNGVYSVILDQDRKVKQIQNDLQTFKLILNNFDKHSSHVNQQILNTIDINYLNKENGKILEENYNKIRELLDNNHKYLNQTNLIRTETLLREIKQRGDDIKFQTQSLNFANTVLDEKLKEEELQMQEIDDIIPSVIEHVTNLMERSENFQELFQNTKVGAEEALSACNAYKNILESIESARNQSQHALEAAKDTKERLNPSDEIPIEEEGGIILKLSQRVLADSKEESKKVEGLKAVIKGHEHNVEIIDDTIYRSGIENNQISNTINNLNNDKNAKTMQNALDASKKISDQMKEVRKEATDANNELYKLKMKLSNLEPEWDTKHSLAEENISQSLSNIREANKNIAILELQSNNTKEKFRKLNSTVLLNLQGLKDKIAIARQIANGISPSIVSGKTKCIRSYFPTVFGLSSSTVIKISIALNSKNENSPLIFIHGDGNKFMALEMVNRRIKLVWNLGGNTGYVLHTEEIKVRDPKYDDAWYHIEANRTMNIGSLVVRQMTNIGTLMNSEILTNYSDAEHTFFYLNRNSRIWMGAVPETIKNDRLLSEQGLGVYIHQIHVDRNQIGLWNYNISQGECQAQVSGAQETSSTISERHFNGEGYAKIEKRNRRLYKKTSFTIQMTFKTLDENALMFLAVDEVNNRSVSLTLYEGRIVFRVDYGGESKLEINTTKKYNTGTWVNVEASRDFTSKRNTENGIINVNGEEQAGSPTSPINSQMLPDFSNDLFYLGGVPPGFKSGTTKAPGADHAFLGCMKDIQINRDTPDPLASSLHFGVEATCKAVISKAGFYGNGYVELPSHSLRKRANFGFIFQTLQSETLLLLSTYPPKITSNYDSKDLRGKYSVALIDGHILLWMNTGNGSVELKSNRTFNDGEFHVLNVLKLGKKIELRVDDESEAIENLPNSPFAINMPEEEGGLYFGGIPEFPEYDTIVPTSIRFNGTIADLVFNSKTISFDQTLNFTSVQLGRAGPAMGSLKLNGETIGKSFKKTPEGCQRVGSYSYEPNAFKFGDGKNSYSIVNISKLKFWQHNFLIEFDFRTFYPNGVIFVTPGLTEKQKHYITLTLKDGHLLLTFRGKRKAELKQSPKLNDGQWHHVIIKCVDRVTTINVNYLKGKQNTVHLKLPKKLHLANMLSVGGIPENRSSLPKQVILKLEQIEFKGCIRRLTVNNQTQDLARPDLHRNIGQCFPRVEKGSYFPGDAYAIYNRKFDIGKHLEFKLEFKTSELNGLLLSVSEPEGYPALSLEIFNGNIILSCDLGNGNPNRLESNLPSKFALCDNKWHTITALYDHEQIGLRIDEQPFIVGLSQYRVPNMISTKSPLYIGGLPDTASSGTLLSQDNFKGCIKNIVIGNDIKDWTDMDELHSVLLSECLSVN